MWKTMLIYSHKMQKRKEEKHMRKNVITITLDNATYMLLEEMERQDPYFRKSQFIQQLIYNYINYKEKKNPMPIYTQPSKILEELRKKWKK